MKIDNRKGGRLQGMMRRFACDTHGNIAIISAFVIPLLLLITFGGIDLHRATTVKSNLQDALDAATLAAARSNHTTNAEITTVGLASLRANLAPFSDITLVANQTTFTLNASGAVIANARVNVNVIVANIILPLVGRGTGDSITVAAHSEVVRASQNVEVALILDTTGSMAGTKIADLKLAAKDLVDIVVQPVQTPWYSKVSIVPYSMAVNVDTAATTARGTPLGSTNITNITWSTGTVRTVSGITQANTAVVSSTGHGFANGDRVVVWGQSRMIEANARVFTVANRQANSFQLSGINSNSWKSFSTSGTTYVAKCARNDCYPTVTATNHGIPSNDTVVLTEVGGMTQLNTVFETTAINNNSYLLNTVGYGTYTSGGRSWCGQNGCSYRGFTNADGALVYHPISTCVTERTGTNAYTDVSPATVRLGFNYPASSNTCLENLVRPLSSNRTTIKTQIDALKASGSTGGHIGVAWGWYTVSPNFNAMWPSSTAAAYSEKTLKAVVLMTDGEYNSAYCTGVIARDSTTGSGGTNTHINCNAPNGSSFSQTQALCASMKRAGVIVYTVGFQVVDDQRARDIVNQCATSPNHVYMPTSGRDLRESFQAIGRDITNMRISR